MGQIPLDGDVLPDDANSFPPQSSEFPAGGNQFPPTVSAGPSASFTSVQFSNDEVAGAGGYLYDETTSGSIAMAGVSKDAYAETREGSFGSDGVPVVHDRGRNAFVEAGGDSYIYMWQRALNRDNVEGGGTLANVKAATWDGSNYHAVQSGVPDYLYQLDESFNSTGGGNLPTDSIEGVTWDGTNFLAAHSSTNGYIYKLDTSLTVVGGAAAPTGDPGGMTTKDGKSYHAARESAYIYELDLGTLNVTGGGVTPINDPSSVAWDGRDFLVPNGTGRYTYVLDTDFNVIGGDSLATTNNSADLAWDGGQMISSGNAAGYLYAFSGGFGFTAGLLDPLSKEDATSFTPPVGGYAFDRTAADDVAVAGTTKNASTDRRTGSFASDGVPPVEERRRTGGGTLSEGGTYLYLWQEDFGGSIGGGSVPGPGTKRDVAFDGSSFYTWGGNANYIYEFDQNFNVVGGASAPIGNFSGGIAWHGGIGEFILAGLTEGYIYRLDTGLNVVGGNTITYSQPVNMTVRGDNWLVIGSPDYIYEHDSNLNVVGGGVPQNGSEGIANVGEDLLIHNNSGYVYRLDLDDFTTVGGEAFSGGIDEANGLVWDGGAITLLDNGDSYLYRVGSSFDFAAGRSDPANKSSGDGTVAGFGGETYTQTNSAGIAVAGVSNGAYAEIRDGSFANDGVPDVIDRGEFAATHGGSGDYLYMWGEDFTNQVGGRSAVAGNHQDAAWDGSSLWIMDFTGAVSYIYELDSDLNVIGGATPTGAVQGIGWNGSNFLLPQGGLFASSEYLYVTDANFNVTGGDSFPGDEAEAASWDGQNWLVSDRGNRYIYFFDTDLNVSGGFSTGFGRQVGVGYDGTHYLTVSEEIGYIYKWNDDGEIVGGGSVPATTLHSVTWTGGSIITTDTGTDYIYEFGGSFNFTAGLIQE